MRIHQDKEETEKGQIIERLDDRSYLVQKTAGRHIVTNRHFLHRTKEDFKHQEEIGDSDNSEGIYSKLGIMSEKEIVDSSTTCSHENEKDSIEDCPNISFLQENIVNSSLHRSTRISKKPDLLSDYIIESLTGEV